ncbi:MAG: hypothetical protein EP329_05230 [Deltaproteobacteria bacterium]|nr:MAG: hypothetical protein EP329_05230 [Deltaproteobacteria bacterium]
MKHRPDDGRLVAIFNAVEAHIERRWHIPVVIRDVPAPFTGDLDGREIHVDYALDIAEAVFIIAHLFGHTVQWNLSEEARKVGTTFYHNATDEELALVHAYETEACQYSLQLFHDAGVHDCDAWLSDFAACDFAYLSHFYRTGEKLDFFSLWRDDTPVLAALPIPDFTPTSWRSRWSGVVV